jgi:site-specific DNA recombinase
MAHRKGVLGSLGYSAVSAGLRPQAVALELAETGSDRDAGDRTPAGPLLLSVAEQIDTRSAAGRLVLNILASVSQWEREAIGERTATALSHKAERGERVGQMPLGYAVAEDGVKLLEQPDEQQAIRLVHELRAGGMSIRAIAAELTRRGVLGRGERWHPTTVARLLQRAA